MMSDAELIRMIKSGQKEKAFAQIYKTVFPKVKSYLLKKSCSPDESKDIFQESVLNFYLKVIQNKLTENETNIGGYIMYVAQMLWIDKTRRAKKVDFVEDYQTYDSGHTSTPLVKVLNQENVSIINKLLGPLGEKCSQLLKLVIYHNYSMREIATEMGLSNEDAAKTQHYKCKIKLVQIYKENTSLKSVLKSMIDGAHE